ncbi:MAG TPA: ATP-dependent helicase, partial [Euryarchaeota archaeon]|nr:ATP-dependent helicase [Euryarchaeota archaeon]
MVVKISPYIWPDDRVLGMFHPVVRMWFMRTYSSLTDIQRRAIPLIHKGKSVLMISPTGSGKTLAAFMSAINELFILASKNALENKVYVVYVSPLRALSNDIRKNLEGPIEGIKKLAEEFGLEIPEIRYLVRTGDTKQYERSKMLKKAPHILITTPETLSIVITSIKFRELLKDIKYVIVDEIHELCSSKRGVHLSLSLERLQEYVGKPIVRIGMSATQAPIEEIAKFLVGGGIKNGNWIPRDVYIVKSSFQKDLDILVHSPGDLVTEGPETVNRKMYELLIDYIKKHRTTLVFTNTRSGAEAVSYKLKELGLENVGTHHSSLSPEVRLKVEDDLKNGRLKAVVTSTSLELGIDIGYVDLVCEIGSPKSISRGIQRIGRSGHAVHARPKGRFIAINTGDLIECAVIARCAKMGKIDRIKIPENSLDVLAQHIVGMSLEKKWRIEDAYRVVKRAYPYRNLSFEEFLSVLEYLGGTDERLENLNVYRKIWVDFKEGVFGRKKGARVIYNLNIGTIPEETKYAVVLHDSKRRIVGYLSEDFATELKHGDIFVLAGSTYEFLGFKGTKVYVRPAPGKRPTIPSWIGEMLPRSYDLSIEVMKFREVVEGLVKKVLRGKKTKEDVIEYLMKEYYVDKTAANVIFNLFKNQLLTRGFIPSFRNIAVEHYIDEYGKYHIIFHYPFGRKVNDALSRAYAAAIGAKHKVSVGITVTDDGFMLTLPKMIVLDEDTIKKLVTPENIEDILKKSLRNTELFNQRFRHCAVRAFMILRNYKGYEISAKNQYLKAMNILKASKELEKTHPVFIETYREILTQHMDINGAKTVLSNILSGKWRLRIILPTDVPMPFSHEIIATGYEDVVLMEDRATVLRKLLQKVKTKVLQENVEFKDIDYLDRYFKLKRWLIIKGVSKDDLFNAVKTLGFIPLSGSENIFERFTVKEDVLRKWISEMLESGIMTTVFLGRRYLTLKEYERYFS